MKFTFVRFIIVGIFNTFVGLSVIYLLLNGAVVKSIIRFIGVILFCYVISYSTGKYLVEALLIKNQPFSLHVVVNIQVFVSACLYTGFNYLLQKLYVFPVKESQKLRDNI
jgi:putative flippase GtrA